MTLLAYILGILTPFVVFIVAALLWAGFHKDGTIRSWCNYDDHETYSQRAAVRWVIWQLHIRTRKHHDGVKLGPAWKRHPRPDWYKSPLSDIPTVATDEVLGADE